MLTDLASSGAQVDYARLDARLDIVAREYPHAEPFPHVVLDDFLDAAVARQVLREFPPIETAAWINWTHVNERKTDADSFHGHPEPMGCPAQVTRKSLALYYFTAESRPFPVRSTDYRARPGDGLRRVAIYLDKMALRGYDRVKRTLGLDDRFASWCLRLLSRLRGR